MAELLPCPFCGGGVSIAKAGDKSRLWWFITRGNGENKCTCRVFMESEEFCVNDTMELKQRLKQDLIDKWNTRTPKERGGEK